MKLKGAVSMVVLAAALLSGCAGSNFVRPAADALATGTSTKSDVVQKLGKPERTGEITKNDKKLDVATYVYAQNTGVGAYPGVIAARSLTYTFLDGVLTSQEFMSSFKEDVTDFDGDKVPMIIKGKSTRADVVSLLGKPTGEAIFPVIPQQNEKALIYSYSQTTGTVFNLKFYSKSLVVSFDPNDVVSNVEYTSSGSK
ncbi:hypothetical protein NA655_19875 [Pseudomonas kuykendallii]|uniref:Beta-barrel assembly machine subunit BamE n=1 Tax=Pseudomonas kuykendallii TaxID=1007099 RepID=A0A1H3A4H8_9PSED|nr:MULTISPECIES: outer membrane protein assembly factor BamE [Pseudomonas]MCQ4273299.1 hypothetical protein [Pseudomonas kuykendallii]SDX24495.1 hypothetical protein SAMN05216287_2569 [Pseudomonas kuykendallii]